MVRGFERGVAGFTLVEVMIASFLSTLLLLGVYVAMLKFIDLVVTARQHNEAQTLAMDRIWSVFNQPYQTLRDFSPNPQVEQVPSTSPLFPYGGTLRTGVLVESNACTILVAVDWMPLAFGGQPIASRELLSLRRSPVRR